MDVYKASITFLNNKEKDSEKLIQYYHRARDPIAIGSSPENNVRITNAEPIHCRIYVNPSQKITIENLSDANPIHVNNEAVKDKTLLSSGDIITVMSKRMRWETYADLKRRTAHLSKNVRKELKHKYVKTDKRVTIHNFTSLVASEVEEAPKDSIEEEKVSDLTESESEVGVQLQPLAPQKEAIAESEETTADQTSPPSPNKENLKTPAKNVINLLNVSGVLQTSYTPSARARTRSVSKTPYNTPERSPAVKNILKESPSVSNPKTPASAKRSMYLIDLVTPQVQKNSTSTPRSSVSTHNKTPRTLGKTPLRKEALLKSAIKNSAVKNNVSTQPATPSKQKALFASASPAFDSSASIIEVSMSSTTEEIDASGTPVKESSVDGGESETMVISSQSSDEDVKNLLDSINNVLEEKPSQDATDNARNISMLTEKDETQVIEKNFNKILDGNNESVTESIFGDEPASNTIVEKFEELVTGKGNNSTEKNTDVQKKGEDLLNLIANVKEAIQTEPNNTTQILSARYSNITPNDSLVDTSGLNASKNYDARTPKLSILGTITSLRKSDAENKLAKSPVSRLSITHNSTEVVENYQLNTDIPKSLRSTRKRIGSAMSSVLNTSTCADTTIDPNESLNVSVQQEVNQSQTETTNILSLDDQPINKSDVAEAEISNNFIQFAGHDEDNNQTEIFEITSEHSGSNKDENEEPASDSESSSEEEQEEEDDEIYSSEEESNQSENKSCMKFRLSGLDDLVEEGIKPLDTSITEDAPPAGEDDEMNVDENNEAIDTEEVPQPANESLIEENISSSDCISSQEIPSSQEECVSVVESQSIEKVKTEQESICPDSAIVSDDINETTGEDITEKKEADETIQLVDESMNDISGENSAAHIEIPETQQFDFNTEEKIKEEEAESTVLSDDDQQEEKVTCIEIEEEVSVKGRLSTENVETVEKTPSNEETKDLDDVQEENGLVNASVQSLNSTSNDFEKNTSGGDIEIPETQQFELNEEVSLDKEMEALEETQNEDATHNESSLYQVEEEVTPSLSKTQEATDNAQTEEQTLEVDNSSEIVCHESASSQALGNETSSEMEEEHLRSSFLATIENEVEEKVEENSTTDEQPPAEAVEDEIPINKSEYVEEEYLETSALESFSKQKPRESELFSETEFSRVEVSSFIDRLKTDVDSPKEVAVDDDVTSEKIEEDVAADEPPAEVNAVESHIDEGVLEEVPANDTNALESTESPPENTKDEEEVQQVVENQEAKEQTIEEKLDLMMGENSEPKPTETTQQTTEKAMEDDESNKFEPVEEEPCVKKYAYVTTDDTTPLAIIETPSKRRTTRINYSELASGSPARSRKARSVSVESNKQEEKEKPSSSQNPKIEPITENNETKEEVTAESVTPVDDETVEDKAPSEKEDKQEEPIEADAQGASDDNCILIESSEDDEAKSSKALPDEKDDQQLVTEVENENTDEIVERETAADIIQIDDDSEGNDEPSKDEATDNVESSSEVAIDTPTASIGSEQIDQKEPQDVGDDIQSVDELTKEEEPIKEELTQPPSSEVENDSTAPESKIQNDQVEEIAEKEKSVERETTAKPAAFETPSKRRAARVNYTELATGSPAKLRKTRSTSIDTNKDEKVPANNPKMATIVEDDVTLKISAELADKAVEKKAEPAEEHSTVEVAEAKTKARRKREVVMQESVATPTRRARRGVTPSVVHQEPETKPAESQPAVSEEPVIKKGRGGRKAKVVEDVGPNNEEKASASQVKAEQLEEHAEVAEKIPSPPPAKKGRGRKHKIEEESQTEEVKTETAETSPKRSRRGISKDVEIIDQKPKEPPKRGRGKKVKEPEVESEQNAVSDSQKDVEAEKAIVKRGREKKTKGTEVEDDKATADPEPKTEVEQPPVKRGRGKKTVVEPATEVDVPSELTVDLTEEKPVEIEKPVAKRGRGKKAYEPEPDAAEKELKEEIEKPTAKRGRGKKFEEPPPETSSKTEEIEKPAARRGRGKKFAEPEVQSKEDEAVVEPEKIAEVEKPVAAKRGRGKRAAAPESEIEQKPDASEKVVEIEKPAPKRGRGKNVKETQVDTTANEAVATTSQDASPKRARAARGVSKDVETKPIEEQPPPKRTRGRKAAVIAEQPEEEEDTPIEAVETKKGRGRKAQVGKKEAKEQTPESSPQVRRDKTPVARATKKQVTIVTPSQMEKRSDKEKTTSPKLAVIEEEPKAKRGPKRAATKVTDEVPTAKRPTRGRK